MSDGYVDATATDRRLKVEHHEEWFRTGDLGSLDEGGNLTYVDRVKDSLRRRGENVSSVEVETTVMRHPAVLEAAAVAIPSDLGEDDILVVVTLRPGTSLNHAELLDFCSARIVILLCSPLSGSAQRHTEERDRAGARTCFGNGVSAQDAWDREANGYILTR